MEVLVTGPDGVLGSNLVRELLNRNYKVSVLVEAGKDPITLRGLPIQVHYGNILDKNALNETFKNKDIIFHCAASTLMFPARNEIVRKVNIDGTKNIIDACLNNSIKKLIYVGTATSFGYGTSHEQPGNETIPYKSAKFGIDYLDSKLKAQEMVIEAAKKQNLPAIIVNPTYMLGPFDSRPSSGAMVIAIAKNKVPGSSSGGKNYIAVKDVATAMANAITMGRVGECYILGNRNMGYKEAFETIAKTIGAKAPKRMLPDTIVKMYGSLNTALATIFKYYPAVTKELAIISTENQFYSADKARKELQLPETPIEVAIKECYDWFIENGYLQK